MARRKRVVGEEIDLIWDGEPDWRIVYGHVDADAARRAVAPIDDSCAVEQTYARSVKPDRDNMMVCDGVESIVALGYQPGRGAYPVTVVHHEPKPFTFKAWAAPSPDVKGREP